MCGRFVLVDKIEVVEKVFNAVLDPQLSEKRTILSPKYNIAPGQHSLVITNDKPNLLQSFLFGLTPSWAKKPMYLFNARSEGEHNPTNDPSYSGAKGIIEKPAFRKSIRSRRCLVIASAFVEGTSNDGLDKPYLVHMQKRPFAMAGIWDHWLNPEDQQEVLSFSIITTTANELVQKFPHNRMPVILSEEQYRVWLNSETPLSEITNLLRPYPAELMNAYPISPAIKSVRNSSKGLLLPLGPKLQPEYEIHLSPVLVAQGFGIGKRSGR